MKKLLFALFFIVGCGGGGSDDNETTALVVNPTPTPIVANSDRDCAYIDNTGSNLGETANPEVAKVIKALIKEGISITIDACNSDIDINVESPTAVSTPTAVQ